MATKIYEGKKNIEGKSYSIKDALTVEEALQLNINNKAFTVSMRTPGNDKSLVRGLLHSERIGWPWHAVHGSHTDSPVRSAHIQAN